MSAIAIARTFDADRIHGTITHPLLYPHLSDDGSPDPDHFAAPMGDFLFYLEAHSNENYLGLFLFHPQNSICYEAHTCLLPVAWGETAIQCARAAIDWMFRNTPCRRVVTNVPAYNRHALQLAQNAGMTQFGVNEKSYLKNGILHDQIMLGLSKEASCQ